MKRRLLALALCLALVCGTALAERQLYADQDGVRVFVEYGKAGLLDAAGEIILVAEYDYIEPFDGADYAVVSQDGLQGVVLRDGTFTVPCRAYYIDQVTDTGLAEVEYDGDARDYLVELTTGRVLHEGERCSYRQRNDCIVADYYGSFDVDSSQILDLEGNVLLAAEGNVYEYADGLAVVVDADMNASLVDLQGNVLLEGMQNSLHISEGKAFYNWQEETPEGERWHCGIWRRNGDRTELVADSYTRFASYTAPYCVRTEDGDRVGYVDDDCQWVIPPVYEDGYAFVNGAAVVCEGGEYRLIDAEGNPVGDVRWTWDNFNSLYANFVEDKTSEPPVLPVDVDGVTRLIDRQGRYVSDAAFRQESYGVYSIRNRWMLLRDPDGRLCLVDGQDGRVLLREDAENWMTLYNGDAVALWLQVDGLWGWMDYSGENAGQWRVEPCAIEVEISYYGTGIWAVLPDGSTVLFDSQGRLTGPGWEYDPDADEW